MDLPEPDDRLNSWKEVAAFLGRGVRTVQRWEKTDGLPLRRGGPGQRGAVIASKREIGQWWERRRATLRDEASSIATCGSEDGETIDRPAYARGPILLPWRVVLSASVIALVIAITTAAPHWRRVDLAVATPAKLGRLLAASTTEGRTESFIPLNATPSGLVLGPSGGLAYVSLHQKHAVAIVDLRARKIVDQFDVVEHPGKLALSPDGTRLVITGSSELGVVDVRSRTLKRFAAAEGIVRDVHLSRDGRSVWITLAQAGLKILDLETGRWEILPTIGCPMNLAPAPRSRRLFLGYQCGGPFGRPGHDAIEIIDEIRRTSILARAGPPLVGSHLVVSPDEQHVWTDTSDACANPAYDGVGCPPGSGPVLHVLSADTLNALLTIRVPGDVNTSPSFFPDGTRLVLAGSSLHVIDRGLGTVLESIDRQTGFGTFTPDGRRFLALDAANHRLLDFEVSPPPDPNALREVVSQWNGDGTANDVMGGAHALTTKGLRFEPGRYGRAFSFDGVLGEVSFGARFNADFPFGPSSIAAWIRTRSSGLQHIASRTRLAGWSWFIKDRRLAFCTNNEQPDFSCGTGGLAGRTTLQPGRWYHVAAVGDGATLTLFLDGRQDGSMSLSKAFHPPASERSRSVLRFGADQDGSAPFIGLIDEVLLFRRALSAFDLTEVMRATRLDGAAILATPPS